MPPKKPLRQTNYLRQGPSGFYVFRRRIPEKLQGYLGKREWKVALRTKRLAEATLMAERHLEASEKAFMQARIALGMADDPMALTQFSAFMEAKRKLAGWHLDSDDVQDGYAMELLDAAERGRITAAEKEELKIISSLGKHQVNPTVLDAFDLYRAEQERKGRTEVAKRTALQMIDRVQSALEASLGSLKVDITTISRAQARGFKESLSKRGFATATVNRNLSVVTAVFTLAIKEYELNRVNPFGGLKDAVDDRDSKMPFEPDQIQRFIQATPEGELRNIVRILAGTGARVAEIVGLKVEDVDLASNIPHLIIRPNEARSVKTRTSQRRIPLVGIALEATREAMADAKNGWLFPRHHNKGSTVTPRLSEALRGKAGITDEKLTTHSLRHAVIQALRDGLVPEAIALALVGHASGNAVNSAYGNGVALDVLRQGVDTAVGRLGLK